MKASLDENILPQSAETVSTQMQYTWKNSLILLLLSIPLSLYFWFGLQHLGQFETADEYRWIYSEESRIPVYWKAMENHNWKDTMINDKPGISTAIISGLALKYDNNLQARFVKQEKYSDIFSPQDSQRLNFNFRFPIIVFNGLLAIFWYFILRRLFDDNWTSLFAISLIMLSPTLLGISQIVNPDSLLWSTSFTSVIAFLAFLKERKWYDVLLSGIFFGFALLSKYTTVILIPYFFALTCSYLIFKHSEFITEKVFRKRVLQFQISFLIVSLLGILIYSLLMPATFIDPKKILLKGNDAFKAIIPYLEIIMYITGAIIVDAIAFKSWILKKILFPFQYIWEAGSRSFFGAVLLVFSFVLFNWTKGNYFAIPNIAFDSGNDKSFRSLEFIHQTFLEVKPLLFSLTLIIIFLLLISFIVFILKKKTKNNFVFFSFCLLPVFFYTGVLMQGYLVHIRYSLMIYPVVIAMSVLGIMEITPFFRWRPLIFLFIFSEMIWFSFLNLKNIYPFYFNYTNELLPKNSLITSSWGFGGYEAAQFINKQSASPKDLIVWTDYDGFCPFFEGKCIKDSSIKWVGYKTVNDIDYYVVTGRGLSKFQSTWSKMKDNVENKPQWELIIGKQPENFIQVYKVNSSNYTSDNWWK